MERGALTQPATNIRHAVRDAKVKRVHVLPIAALAGTRPFEVTEEATTVINRVITPRTISPTAASPTAKAHGAIPPLYVLTGAFSAHRTGQVALNDGKSSKTAPSATDRACLANLHGEGVRALKVKEVGRRALHVGATISVSAFLTKIAVTP